MIRDQMKRVISSDSRNTAADFIDDIDDEFERNPSILHARADLSSRVIPDTFSEDAEDIALDVVRRSKEVNARDRADESQAVLDVLLTIGLSAGPVSKRVKDIRCARENAIIHEMNSERKQQRLMLANAGEAVPEELQEHNDLSLHPERDGRSNGADSLPPQPQPRRFINLQWVRPIRGKYADDLALVFYPVVNGNRWPPQARAWPEYVQVLVVPRWDVSSQSKELQSDSRSKRKRSSRPPQVTLLDGPDHSYVGCNSKSVSQKSSRKAALYFNLLFMTTPATNLRESAPRSMYELEPFVAAEFDVRQWKRRLSQDSLRPEERVRIVSGDLSGQVGVVVEILQDVATVVLTEQDEKDSELQEASVVVKHLERHFQVGDNVRCVTTSPCIGYKVGTVVEVKEWAAEDYATLQWVPNRDDPFRVLNRDSSMADKVRCFDITVLQMPQGTTVSNNRSI